MFKVGYFLVWQYLILLQILYDFKKRLNAVVLGLIFALEFSLALLTFYHNFIALLQMFILFPAKYLLMTLSAFYFLIWALMVYVSFYVFPFHYLAAALRAFLLSLGAVFDVAINKLPLCHKVTASLWTDLQHLIALVKMNWCHESLNGDVVAPQRALEGQECLLLSAKLIEVSDSNILVLHSNQKRADDIAHHETHLLRLKLLLALGALRVFFEVSVALNAFLAENGIVALVARLRVKH